MYRLRRLSTIALLLFVVVGAGGAPDSNETVRVRLFSDRNIRKAVLSDSNGGRLTLYDASGALATLEKGQELEFDIWNEFPRARWQSGSVPLDHAFVKTESAALTLTVDGDSRQYRGSIELVLDDDLEKPGLLLINEVALSDYIGSVLPAEYGFKEPEGVKAQAIVIRTYALRAIAQRQGLFDVTDGTSSQVYPGVSSETDLARAAVEATSGMTITHDGELIEAVYSAHCGGHSANNEDVWQSKPISYLRGRKDPYDEKAPVAHWETRIDKKDLLDLLSKVTKTKVKGITVSERGSGKRVTEIKLDTNRDDVDMSAQSFRVAVNGSFGATAIKSTFFELKKDGDSYRFSGRGLGHGVGLCQWGAAEQAKEGRSFRDILSFYYSGVKVEGRDSDTPFARASLTNALEVAKVSSADQPSAKQAKSRPKESPKKTPAETKHRQKTTSRKLTGRRVGW